MCLTFSHHCFLPSWLFVKFDVSFNVHLFHVRMWYVFLNVHIKQALNFSDTYVVHVNVFVSLQVIKVYNEDNTSRAVEVPTDITARDICQLFVMKNHCIDDHSWTLFEHLTHLSIGKI